MKRLLSALVLIIVCASALSALDFAFGPKVVVGDYSSRGADWEKDYKDVGWENNITFSGGGGVFVNFQFIDLLGIQIEALYNHLTLRWEDTSDPDGYWYQESFNTISIPVYARFNFGVGSFAIFVMAGPKFTFLMDEVKWKDEWNGIKDDGDYKISDDGDLTNVLIGAAVAAGVKIPVGPGFLDVGMGFNTVLNEYSEGTKEYGYGIDIQVGYGFTL